MNYWTVLHIAVAVIVLTRGWYLIGTRMSNQTDWRIRASVAAMTGAAPFTVFYQPAIVVMLVATAVLVFIDRRLPDDGISHDPDLYDNVNP